MARKKFNFKSSGKKRSENRDMVNPNIPNGPIGIKTPLEFARGRRDEDFYRMNFDGAKQIADNFRNLILTNYGERLGRPEIGANLKSLLYDMVASDSIEAEAARRITEVASRYLPMIEVKEINIRFLGLDRGSKNILDSSDYSMLQPGPSSSGLSGMVVLTKYDIPRIGVTNQAIETILTIGG